MDKDRPRMVTQIENGPRQISPKQSHSQRLQQVKSNTENQYTPVFTKAIGPGFVN
jgi:hypothetical protein